MGAFYKHTQRGYFWPVLAILTVIAPLYIPTSGTVFSHEIIMAMALEFCLLLLVTVFMSSLTVIVDEQFLRFHFGGYIFHKKIKLVDIESAEPVRKLFVFGWGIRWYIKGWLYNVWGLDAVQINFKNGKQLRIGTNEPEKLSEQINNCLVVRDTDDSSI